MSSASHQRISAAVRIRQQCLEFVELQRGWPVQWIASAECALSSRGRSRNSRRRDARYCCCYCCCCCCCWAAAGKLSSSLEGWWMQKVLVLFPLALGEIANTDYRTDGTRRDFSRRRGRTSNEHDYDLSWGVYELHCRSMYGCIDNSNDCMWSVK
jgi:hypothetical protein